MKSILSDNRQLTRITILAGILLLLIVLVFGGYYYSDRYYHKAQPEVSEVSLAQAEQAVRDDPQSLEMRLALAESYLLNQRLEDAITQSKQVMASEPENDRAWLVLGVASAMSGKPADAIEPLNLFVEAHKDDEMPGLNKALQAAAYYLGDSYLQLGQPQEAIEPLTKAVDWSQTDADAMYKLGMAYSGVQDYDNAVNMFQAATTFVPNFKEAYDAMALAYDASGKLAHAEYARGMSAYSEKDFQAALPLLLQATQAEPEFVSAFAGLGLTYEALNQLQEARSAYQAAVAIDVNNFTASRGLERVEILINKP